MALAYRARRRRPEPRYTMGTVTGGGANGLALVRLDSGHDVYARIPRAWFYLPRGIRVAMFPYPDGPFIVGWVKGWKP